MGKKLKPVFAIAAAITATAVLLGLYLAFLQPRTYVIGYINPNPTEFEGAQGFLRNMPAFGYIEGANTTYIKCETQDKTAIEDAIKEMVAKKVDLIMTMTTPATKMAKEYTEGTGIPVVFILYDATRSGVVESLRRPDSNLTGVQLGGGTPKSLEKLLEIKPAAKHILTPICFDTGAAKRSLEDLADAAKKLEMQLTVAEVNTLEELRNTMNSMPADIDAIFILHTWLVGNNLEPVIAEAVKRKIPVLSAGHVHFDNGLLFSYGPRDEETGVQVARLAHNILKHGAPTTDLPVETSDFFLGINLKTAEAAGIDIPYNFLQQADFIAR